MAARPNFLFCICPDAQLIQQHINTLIAADTGNTWVRYIFWGEEELPQNFWELLTLQGLFSTPGVLIVRNAEKLPIDTWKQLSKILSRPNPNVWPIFCLESIWEKRNPKIPVAITAQHCFQFAEKKEWLWRSPGLTRQSLRPYIQNQAKAHGLCLAPGTLEKLCTLLPLNAAAVDTELSKLAMLTPGKALTPEEVEIEQVNEFVVFNIVRQLQSGQISNAWALILDEQHKGNELLFPLLGILQREARQIWQLLMGEGSRTYIPPGNLTIQKKTAITLGTTGLVKLWNVMQAAELSVKSGQKAPGQALEALMKELSCLFSQG